jgi:hypothetical protein
MDIYKTEKGKTYLTLSKDFDKDKAKTIGNDYFHAKRSEIMVESGKVTGDSLEVGVDGDVWAISRRSR